MLSVNETATKRYLVTGGAGFLGINLVRFLLDKGQQVRSLDIAAFDYPEAGQVDAIVGDIRDPDVVRRAVEGIDIVVHAAAALPLYKPEEIRSVDIDGTRVCLEASLAAGVERFIQISSTAVYGIPDHHPIVEDDPLSGVGPYGEAKIAAEELCASFRERGLCVPILRPKSFIGPERLGIFELLYDFAYQGRNFPVLGPGTNRYQLLDVEDLCRAIYLCATKAPELVDDVFNVGAREFTTIRDDFQAVLDRAGHGKRVVSVPKAPAIWALRVLQALGLSPVYPWVYETVAQDSWVSTDKIRDILGFTPEYSNREALVRNYDWYVVHRESILKGGTGISHRAPWKRGALRLVSYFF